MTRIAKPVVFSLFFLTMFAALAFILLSRSGNSSPNAAFADKSRTSDSGEHLKACLKKSGIPLTEDAKSIYVRSVDFNNAVSNCS